MKSYRSPFSHLQHSAIDGISFAKGFSVADPYSWFSLLWLSPHSTSFTIRCTFAMNLFSRYIFFMISVMYFGSCDSSSSPSEIILRIDWFETFDGADARLLMNSLLYLKLGLLDDLCFFNWNGLKFYPEMLSCCIFKSSCKLAITSFL